MERPANRARAMAAIYDLRPNRLLNHKDIAFWFYFLALTPCSRWIVTGTGKP